MPLDPLKIRARRKALKLTQTQAAERAGMLQPNWARIELGTLDTLKFSTADKIAAALKCSVAKLTA